MRSKVEKVRGRWRIFDGAIGPAMNCSSVRELERVGKKKRKKSKLLKKDSNRPEGVVLNLNVAGDINVFDAVFQHRVDNHVEGTIALLRKIKSLNARFEHAQALEWIPCADLKGKREGEFSLGS
jgi:hypothetical protein